MASDQTFSFQEHSSGVEPKVGLILCDYTPPPIPTPLPHLEEEREKPKGESAQGSVGPFRVPGISLESNRK